MGMVKMFTISTSIAIRNENSILFNRNVGLREFTLLANDELINKLVKHFLHLLASKSPFDNAFFFPGVSRHLVLNVGC